MKHKNLKVLAKCDEKGTEARHELILAHFESGESFDIIAGRIEDAWNLSLIQHGADAISNHNRRIAEASNLINKAILGV